MTLERELVELGRSVDFPPEPDVAARVAAGLRPRRRLAFRPAFVALAVLVAALAVALAVPPARSAILELLGLRGATIERVEEPPEVELRAGRELRLVGLERARELAAFPLLVPAAYDEVAWDADLGAVTFLWDERRLLLTEFRGAATPYVEKSAGPGTEIAFVTVNGGPGYWLEGDRHVVVFRDADGRVLEARAAGNVLLWEQGSLTLRLEGAASRAEALELAGTLVPDPG